MARPYRQRLELRPKITVKTKLKYRMVLAGSTLAVAALFGIGVFMYGNIGNNTESFAAKKNSKTINKNVSVPEGPSAINATCLNEQVSLSWTNATQSNGILILRKQGLVTDDQAVSDFRNDSLKNTTTDTTSINGWKVIYNGNLVSDFTDNNASGVFTYLVYEKNNGIKCTAAKNAGRIFVFNGQELSGNISDDTKLDGLYLPATCTFTVNEKSSLTLRDKASLSIGGTFVLSGEMNNNTSPWTFTKGGQFVYDRNGNNKKNAIPNATWETGSTCLVQGVTGREPAGMNQTFANFIWNCPDQSSDVTMPEAFKVNGNLNVKSTGTKIKTLWFDGATTFNGDISVSSSSAKVNMKKKTEMVLNGTSHQVIQGDWNFQTLTVNNPSGATFAGNITVTKIINMVNGNIKIVNDAVTKSSLKIADDVVINCTKGSLTGTPTFMGKYDLNYFAACTTGDELSNDNNSLRNITINCDGSVTLNKSAIINGTLEFINGKIITGNYEVNMKSPLNTCIKGYSSIDYVVGNLRRCVNGKSVYEFPVGTSSNSEIINVDLNKTAGFASVLVHFTNEKPNDKPIAAELMLNGTPVGNMLDYGYWTLTPNSAMTSGTFSVMLNEKGQSNEAPSVNCYCVLTRDDASSTWKFMGNHSMKTQFINNGTVTAARSEIKSFGDFAIGFSGASVLFSRSSLTASFIDDQYTDIVWRTTAEMSLTTVTVERSNDTYNFESIGEMKDNGVKEDIHEFTFRDTYSFPGISYYRLKQTDWDGTVTYSDVRFVNKDSKTNASINTVK